MCRLGKPDLPARGTYFTLLTDLGGVGRQDNRVMIQGKDSYSSYELAKLGMTISLHITQSKNLDPMSYSLPADLR